jgi:hypothetical protein
VASAPATLTLKTHRDQVGRARFVWIRRLLLALVGAVPVLGLLNQFGQRPATSTAAAAQAKLQVYAPDRARSGLVYAARFRVDALRKLTNATLVLWPGWAEQYTVNGLAPQPVTQGSDDGKLIFTFGHVPAGNHLTFWLSLQVNPTNVGHRSQRVQLYDGKRLLVTVDRSITIFP